MSDQTDNARRPEMLRPDRERATASSPRSTRAAARRPRRSRATASRKARGPATRRCSASSMRCASRIITSPCFGSGKVIGAILFERTMDGEVDGKPVPQALIDRGVVPFIKIDKGLEDEENGVQMMKPKPGLDALLERAKGLGVFGTKERSVINLANREPGSRRSSRQQFEVAKQVLAARPGADHRARSEHQERRARRERRPHPARRDCSKQLDEMPDGERVMLKLSIPVEAGPVPAAGRPSQGASGGRLVGRLQPRRGLPRALQEPGHDRQLQPRLARRTFATR